MMLATNVLCLKKRKKKSYCLSDAGGLGAKASAVAAAPAARGDGRGCERSRGTVAMMQITEDTPPDMLAGAMDLTVHLPAGRSVKMSVERSTPMMDLLVQITTNHHLQLSNYTLQALAMSPSAGAADKALPFKPNTPIGTLDTQDVRVLPRARTLPVPRNVPPGHQPFESTFRLKVHLPRNQLYVTRVSRSVQLEDIMGKVCEEKNLDPGKYEFKHPGNLDEVLDPKLTLNDYQITEIYVVQRGTASLNQAFSTNDIMALRKEEERKQMHNKTGGGVLNLIFRRGKSSMGSGSVSSDNRSASPTQSDDSRSVTPPGVAPTPPQPQPQPAPAPPKRDAPPAERPRPPLRKRRPAPPPPRPVAERQGAGPTAAGAATPAAAGRDRAEDQQQQVVIRKPDTVGLTICHSRNSSDSSGYHEASTLSDHGNTSLPRRPKSALIGSQTLAGSATNLSTMSAHSKSTTSLTIAGRKKKAAPPPPRPALQPAGSVASLEKPSPLVASQPALTHPDKEVQENLTPSINPTPLPRPRSRSKPKSVPLPPSRSEMPSVPTEEDIKNSSATIKIEDSTAIQNDIDSSAVSKQTEKNDYLEDFDVENTKTSSFTEDNQNTDDSTQLPQEREPVADVQKQTTDSILVSSEEVKPPEIVAMIPKTPKENKNPSKTDTFGKKRCFKIGSSILEQNFDTISIQSKDSRSDDLSTTNSVGSALEAFNFVDEISDVDDSLFTGSLSRATAPKRDILDQLYGIHEYDAAKLPKTNSFGSLGSASSFPGLLTGGNMKKWDNIEDLDEISLNSLGAKNKWVAGDTSDSESVCSTNLAQSTPLDSLVASNLSITTANEKASTPSEPQKAEDKSLDSTDSGIAQDKQEEEEVRPVSPPPPPIIDDLIKSETPEQKIDPEIDKSIQDNLVVSEIDWHYQLPAPPKAFRDSSPTNVVEDQDNQSVVTDFKDSVVTSPELFEKLKVLEDNQSEKETFKSDQTSVVSEEEKPLNTLSLECLEKRQTLVYNRELSTSLKMTDQLDNTKPDTFSSSLTKFETTFENMSSRSSPTKEKSKPTNTLPNFKITTYDVPKQKIKVFEDDTIRSNTDYKRNSSAEPKSSNLVRSYMGQSMENVSVRKHSIERYSDEDRKEKDYNFYNTQQQRTYTPAPNVYRSESFSTDNLWSPSKPVSRSKSQLVLNKYREEKSGIKQEESMSRSSSLYDVSSGLQSIGVMKLIQNKLNTPTASTENLHQKDKVQTIKPEVKKEPPPKPAIPEIREKPQEKVYQYRGPPSINLGTWSERPKVPVAVKEDSDYKLGNHVSSKLIVNTCNNNITSNNSVEVKGKYNIKVGEEKPVRIRINGSDQITQNSGNLVIKIGGQSKNYDNQRVGYRTTFDGVKERPHSIALDRANENNISRVPVVRSVELKKPFRDLQVNNTSITQIYPDDNFKILPMKKPDPLKTNNNFSTMYRSSEVLPVTNGYQKHDPKPTFRVNNFKPNGNTPVVRGFQTPKENVNRFSWHSTNYGTLPVKSKPSNEYTTNQEVPFSQFNLRRTESSKRIEAENYKNAVDSSKNESDFTSLPSIKKHEVTAAPPPPQMPKVILRKVEPKQAPPTANSRDQLFESIRNFGGKKGLKSAKVH